MTGPKPKEKVKKVWSSKLAYAVGLLATDGNLSKDGRHINLTSKDMDQLETFKRCLELDNKIGKKSRGSGDMKKYFQLQFGDVQFYNWLSELGLHPNKSKTMGKLAIPKRYFFDFLRGCFDGDGCISSYYIDTRWPNSHMFYFRFMSGSRNFLIWLLETAQQPCGATGRIKQNCRQYELAFAKKASRILFEKMFYSNQVPCLKRKLLKVEGVFHFDKKLRLAQVEKLANSPA